MTTRKKKKNNKSPSNKSQIRIDLSLDQLLFLDKEATNLNLRYPTLTFSRTDVIRALIDYHHIRRQFEEYYIDDMNVLHSEKIEKYTPGEIK